MMSDNERKEQSDAAMWAFVKSSPPKVRTAEDERRDVLAFLRQRCAIFHAAAEIERGDHVGAAERKAVKP